MTELIEAVAIPGLPEKHDENTCPFCLKSEEDERPASKIGADNEASKLGDSLASYADEPRDQVGFHHPDYGDYSPEPHHLVSGNEILKGHPIECWLSKKVSGSHVNGDTGFDINHARNGQWLPSTTDANRICKWETYKKDGKSRRRPAACEEGKTMWSQLSMAEKDVISFAIMLTEQMQFHKGNHQNKGEAPSECYATEGKRLLNEINSLVRCALKLECPEAKSDSDGKLPPPDGINDLIYGCASAHLRWHVNGPPESWFVFISKLSRRLFQEAVDSGKTPWDIPYPGSATRPS